MLAEHKVITIKAIAENIAGAEARLAKGNAIGNVTKSVLPIRHGASEENAALPGAFAGCVWPAKIKI